MSTEANSRWWESYLATSVVKQITIGLVLAVGAALTLWGLVQMPWPVASAFAWGSLIRYAIFLVIGTFAVALVGRWTKLNSIVAGGLIACAIAILAGAVWPLVVTIWFAISCYVVGQFFLLFLKVDATKVTGITAFLVGACIYGTAIGLLAHYPVNYPGLYGLALAVPVLLGWRSIHAATHSLRECLTSP